MKHQLKKYSLFIILISIILIFINLRFPQQNIFAYDNFGYYLYLPAKFIQKDLAFRDMKTFEHLNEKYKCTHTFYQLMQSPKGGIIIRMYLGCAILLTPAFFTGHAIAAISGYPMDGFSAPYQWSVIIFGLLLSLAGLVIASKILLRFFDEKTTIVTLLILYLGTNLFFFNTLGNPIPHVYLFNIYVFLLWFVIRWHDKPGWLTAFGIGITIGLILSIRPSDVIVLAVPALWNIWNLETLKAKFNLVLKHWLQVIVMMAAACVIVLPQLLYWRLYAGEYFVSVYNDPSSRMDWKHPDLINVLFSFRKGWLIYSPLIILSLAGIATGLRKNRRWFLPTVVFIILNLYLISCFTSLISYGWRAFLQSYALLLLPLAVFVQLLLSWNRWIKVPFFIIIIFFTYVNIVQAKQIIMGVTDGSRMTKSAFFKVFGRWNAQKPVQEMRVKRTGHELDTLFTANGYNFLELMNFSFEDTRLQQKLPVDSNYAFNGKYSLKTDSTNIYSPALKIRLDSLGFEDHFWVHAHVRLFSFDSLAVEDGNLVVTVNFNRQLVKYKAINCRILKTRFIPGNWNTVAFDYLSPEFIPQDAKLEIYFWNRGKKPIWIDELRAFLYTPKTMD